MMQASLPISFEEQFYREPGDAELIHYSPLNDGTDIPLSPNIRSLWEAEDCHIALAQVPSQQDGRLWPIMQIGSIVRRIDPVDAARQKKTKRSFEMKDFLLEAIDNNLITMVEYLQAFELLQKVDQENSPFKDLILKVKQRIIRRKEKLSDVMDILEMKAFCEKWVLEDILADFEIEKDAGNVLNGSDTPQLHKYEKIYASPPINPTIQKIESILQTDLSTHQLSYEKRADLQAKCRELKAAAKPKTKYFVLPTPFAPDRGIPKPVAKLMREITAAADKGLAKNLKEMMVFVNKHIKVEDILTTFLTETQNGNLEALIRGIEVKGDIYPDAFIANAILDKWKNKGFQGYLKTVGVEESFQPVFLIQLQTQEEIVAYINHCNTIKNASAKKHLKMFWNHNKIELAKAGLKWVKKCPKCKTIFNGKQQSCTCKIKFPYSALVRGSTYPYTVCPAWNLNADKTFQYHFFKDIVSSILPEEYDDESWEFDTTLNETELMVSITSQGEKHEQTDPTT